jgi:FkbM family methyltransferase
MSVLDRAKACAMYELRQLGWRVNRRTRNTITRRTKQGLLTFYSSDPEIGRSLYCQGEYELGLSRQAYDFLQTIKKKSGGTVLDIGANMGVISIGLIYNKLAEKAIAIEPDPQNFCLLQKNVKQNGLDDRIICIQMAVSDVKGKLAFELSEGNFGDRRVRSKAHEASPELYDESSRRTIEVEADSIDHILGGLPKGFVENLGLIWMDTQGHEGNVLLGGKETFTKDITVLSEIWPYGINRSGISDKQFLDVASHYWSNYWVRRRRGFMQYPLSLLYLLFEEIGHGFEYENVIFTH